MDDLHLSEQGLPPAIEPGQDKPVKLQKVALPRTTITLLEAAGLTAICFGLSIALSIEAVLKSFPTAPFTDANTLWSLCVAVIEASIGVLYLKARGFDISKLVPQPTWLGTGAGFVLFFGAWLLGAIFTSPFAESHSQQPISEIMASSTMSMSVVVAFAMVNGTFEEVFLLGALVRGLRGYGLSLALGLPLLVRVSYHLYQGPVGALWIFAFGAVFTLYYIRFGLLWPPVFAHVLWDIVPFAG
jgi:uncharacterized protein